jgi:cytochrome d ubiquinol oxidase subunit II
MLLTPVIFYLFNHPKTIYLRLVIGAQVALIIFGWFAMQFPVIIFEKGGTHLTFYNTQAPYATLYQLFIALIAGLILIVPCFYFLFKVFKGSDE